MLYQQRHISNLLWSHLQLMPSMIGVCMLGLLAC